MLIPLREKIYAKTEDVVIPAIYATPKEFESAIDPSYQTIKEEGKLLWKRTVNSPVLKGRCLKKLIS
jgi:hypothetical protein